MDCLDDPALLSVLAYFASSLVMIPLNREAAAAHPYTFIPRFQCCHVLLLAPTPLCCTRAVAALAFRVNKNPFTLSGFRLWANSSPSPACTSSCSPPRSSASTRGGRPTSSSRARSCRSSPPRSSPRARDVLRRVSCRAPRRFAYVFSTEQASADGASAVALSAVMWQLLRRSGDGLLRYARFMIARWALSVFDVRHSDDLASAPWPSSPSSSTTFVVVGIRRPAHRRPHMGLGRALLARGRRRQHRHLRRPPPHVGGVDRPRQRRGQDGRYGCCRRVVRWPHSRRARAVCSRHRRRCRVARARAIPRWRQGRRLPSTSPRPRPAATKYGSDGNGGKSVEEPRAVAGSVIFGAAPEPPPRRARQRDDGATRHRVTDDLLDEYRPEEDGPRSV